MRVSVFRTSRLLGIISLFAIGLLSCVDQEFDAPPAGGADPDIEPNISIAEVRDLHIPGAYEEITDDLVIEAIVISSDLAGNFFRQLVIQDETGGIEIRIDMTNLDNIFPPGRKVFVKLKGLWLGDFNGLIQLGAAVVVEDGFPELARIPEVLVDDYVLRGSYGHEVEPKMRSIDELTADDVSTLIGLTDVQFIDSDAGLPFADAINNISVNHSLENCEKDQILLRTSGFAAFAASSTPVGKGMITGVLGIFGSDLQLLIRNLEDVDMEEERCQPGGGVDLDILDVREAFEGGQGVAPQGAITGVVISDRANGNHTGRNLYIQDGTAGIVIRFDDNHDFDLGDKLTIDVSGQELSEFNGLLQVNNVPLASAANGGNEPLPAPRNATVEDVLQNAQDWESTRVKLTDVVLSGSATFEGNVTVTDNTGAMIMFTRGQASFSETELPVGEVDVTAIVSEFNAPQLIINSLQDIEGGTGGGGNDIDEDFSGIADNQDVELPGWTNVAVKGSRLWRVQVFDGNHYAQATAFNDSEQEMESWLVTPLIELDVPKVLSFVSAKAFWDHDGFEVLASSNFSGDVTSATWVNVDARLAGESDSDHSWIESGEIGLEQFGQKVHIAFRYVGSGPSGDDTSFRIDDVLVAEK